MKQELALQAALGSHWTKSNKSLLPLSQGEGVTGVGGGVKTVEKDKRLLKNISATKIRRNSAVDLLSLFQLHLSCL